MAGSSERAGLLNGVFVALWALMQFLFSPMMGSLSDRYGRRPVLLLSAAGLGLDYVLMALAPNLWWLALGRIIAGLTTASFTTVYAYMADVTTPEERARAYGLIGAAFSGGFILGPLIGGAVGQLGPRAPFWFAAGLSGVTFLYGLLILPESLKVENRMAFSWKRANPFGAFLLLRSHAELFGLAVVNFLLYFAHFIFPAVMVLYVGWRYGFSVLEMGLVLAFWGALDMLVQTFMVGPAVKRFGERSMMILGLFAGALGFLLMGLAPNGLAFVVATAPSALMGLAMPTIMSLMTQRVSESEQGQLQGANMSVAAVAGVVAPIFFGWVYGLTAAEPPVLRPQGASFLIGAAIMLAAAVMSVVVARKAVRAEAAEQA
jgi:DHA1 family tetracycline resistance protein-like MFS transporter